MWQLAALCLGLKHRGQAAFHFICLVHFIFRAQIKDTPAASCVIEKYTAVGNNYHERKAATATGLDCRASGRVHVSTCQRANLLAARASTSRVGLRKQNLARDV